jgi:phosphate transport system substrate-binding protein
VITYNLPGKPQLRFTPKLLADIFLGHIKNWQDPAIAAVNPGLQLPDLPMTVVHRSEGSGTSFVLTNYLSAVSTEWRERIGAGKLVRWQAGIGVEGNPKVAAFIKKIPGAVGYVESTYAWREKLPQAVLQNKSGRFVSATSEAISQAANIELPDDCRGLIVNTSAEQGYPISAFSYLIVYADQNYAQRSELKGQALVRYLWWAIHQGQAGNAKLWYAPLPAPVVKKAEAIVQAINFAGRPLDPTLNKAIHP